MGDDIRGSGRKGERREIGKKGHGIQESQVKIIVLGGSKIKHGGSSMSRNWQGTEDTGGGIDVIHACK